MTTERIDIAVREDGSRVVKRNLEDIGKGSDKAAASLGALKSILLGVFSAATIAGAIRMADQYTNIQNKLRLVTTGTQNLSRVTKELLAISNQTRSDFAATAELYARMANASKDMGLSQKDLLGFTKTLNQAIILSGASAEEAAGGLRQLAQGMAAGTLRGDELNSVMENFPKVADIIAQGLGVTRGELRKLGAEGKITADIIVDAFKKAEKSVGEDFAKTVPTVAQSMTVLRNNFMSWLGEMDQSLGITRTFAGLLITVANNLNTILPLLMGVGAAVATAFVPSLIAAFTAQVRTLWILVAANPFVALAAVVVGVATALYTMRDSIKLSSDSAATLGDLLRVSLGDVADLVRTVAGTFVEMGRIIVDLYTDALGTFTGMGQLTSSYKLAALDAFEDIEQSSDSTWMKVLKAVARTVDAILGLLLGLHDAARRVFGAISDYITTTFGNSVQILKAIMAGEFDKALEIGKAQIDNMKNTGVNIGEALGKGFNTGFAAIAEGGAEAWLNKKQKEAELMAGWKTVKGSPDELNPGGKPRTVKPPVDADAAKKAARELEQLRSALRGVLDEANPMEAAQRRLADTQDILNKAVKAGLIHIDDARVAYDNIAQSMDDQLHPLNALNAQIEESMKLLGMSNAARQIEGQMLDYTRQLKEAGLVVGEAELEQLRAKLTAEQELARIAAVRDQLEAETFAAQKLGIQDMIAAYGELKETTTGDDFNFLNRLLGGSLDETQAAFDAQKEQFALYYAAIEAFRQQDVKNEEIASAAKRAIKQQEMDMYLQRTADALGAASGLMKSNSKEAFRIGQAAAIGQTIVNTYASATAAYKSAANIPYVGWILGPVAAAGAIAAGMAQVSAIRSQSMPAYRTGGTYTVGGAGGTDSQTVAMRATPGEQISINTPQQAGAMQRMESLMRQQRGSGTEVNVGGITIVQTGRANNNTAEQQGKKAARAIADQLEE